MEKNSAKLLADIVLSPKSAAYWELKNISEDEHGMPSARAAADLRHELAGVLKELLAGNFGPLNEKLRTYSASVPLLSVESKGGIKSSAWEYSTSSRIQLGDKPAFLVKTRSNTATAPELVFGVLRRALESGALAYLALCRRCGRLFHRKSLKGKFCGSRCRFAYFNTPAERHARYGRLLNKRRRRPTKINRRRRKPKARP
jgi:hypothetical protein